MSKKLGFKILALAFILSISAILGTASNVYAWGDPEPPLPGERWAGQALVGFLTIVGDGYTGDEFGSNVQSAHFEGDCGGMSVTMDKEILFGIHVPYKRGDLLGFRITEVVIVPDCPPTGGGIRIAVTVNAASDFNYDQTFDTATAEVVMLQSVLRHVP